MQEDLTVEPSVCGEFDKRQSQALILALSGMMRGNRLKPIKDCFRLSVMRNFFPMRTVRH